MNRLLFCCVAAARIRRSGLVGRASFWGLALVMFCFSLLVLNGNVSRGDAFCCKAVVHTTAESSLNPGFWNQGWWSDRFAQSYFNDNYLTGLNINGASYHGFFTFDLTNVVEEVKTASIKIMQFGSRSSEPTEPLGLFDVSTPAQILNSKPGTVDLTVLEDLGTGKLYGSIEVAIGAPLDTVLEVHLNDKAISDINAQRGGFFSIGASLLDVNPDQGAQSVFGFSGSDRRGAIPPELVLRVIPEPTTSFLMIVGGLLIRAALNNANKYARR